MGDGAEVELDAFARPTASSGSALKARTYLREHEDHLTIRKLRMNKPLTATDLAELERMLHASGVGRRGSLERAKVESEGLGLFVRSLVGLDREAAKEAFAGFLAGKTMTANQIKFVNLIVNHLTEHGVMDPSLLYDSPFTDIAPQGPDAPRLDRPAGEDQVHRMAHADQPRQAHRAAVDQRHAEAAAEDAEGRVALPPRAGRTSRPAPCRRRRSSR
jgi:hypothetical protein